MRGWGVVAVVVCACGNGGGTTNDGGTDGATNDGTTDAPVDAPPTTSGSRVGVTALGIRVPVVAKLDAGPIRRQVLVSQDGTFYFPGRFDTGTSYTLTVNDTRCAIVGATGTTGAADVTAPLFCQGIVELDALQLPSSLQLVPAFDPGAFAYGGKRPLLMDATFPITLTPSAAYPTEATIKVSTVNATSDQPITVPYGTGITIDVTHTSGVAPAQYTFTPSFAPLNVTFAKPATPLPSVRFSSGASVGCASDDTGGLALGGDVMVVGAPCPASAEGSVFIFRRNAVGTWMPEQTITGPQFGAQFGAAVAIDGDTLVIGAPFTNSGQGAAYVYKHTTLGWMLEATLTAANPSNDDHLGWSVAIAGNIAAVGAPDEDSNATGIGGSQTNESAADAGAVYLFTRSGTTWSAPVYIKASNTGAADEFGNAMAMAGTTLVVGARGEDSGAGAAYVFIVSGTPAQQQLLKASNAEAGDFFGWSVAIDSDTVVVGAPDEDSNGTGPTNNTASSAGAAYVFFRTGTTWTEQAYLKARYADTSNAVSALDEFGASVAITGNAIVVGASEEDGNGTLLDPTPSESLASAGAAYTYLRSGATWGNPHYIKAPNTGISDHFGMSVVADGDTFAVGAPGEDSNSTGIGGAFNEGALNSGAVYIIR